MLKQLSYIAPVATVDKNEKYFNPRRSSKTVLDLWVESESQRPKNEEPPSLKITKIARNGSLDLRCAGNNKIFNYQ